jgi:hypothetical protein
VEKMTLYKIRRCKYLAILGLVEEFILPYAIDHARLRFSGGNYRVRAFLFSMG